jgi:hypothetical protein
MAKKKKEKQVSDLGNYMLKDLHKKAKELKDLETASAAYYARRNEKRYEGCLYTLIFGAFIFTCYALYYLITV